ncbi:MAG: hypothetical protein QXT58_05125 [Archaeoglobaceae archaeon]
MSFLRRVVLVSRRRCHLGGGDGSDGPACLFGRFEILWRVSDAERGGFLAGFMRYNGIEPFFFEVNGDATE